MDDRGKAGEEHFRACGVDNARDYLQWCRDNHFRPTTTKSQHQLERERLTAARSAHRRALHAGKDRAIRTLVVALRDDPTAPIETRDRSPQAAVVAGCHELAAVDRNRADGFLDLLDHLDRGSKLTRSVDGVAMIAALVGHREVWIRPPETWSPKSRSPRRQLAELARHLLCRYPVPAFMDRVWFEDDHRRFRDWFIHIGQGGRLSELPDQPVPVSKRIGHHFLRAPRDLTVFEAIRFGQIVALGGPPGLLAAIRSTKLTELTDRTRIEDDFAQSVLRFFIDNPALDRSQVGPIVDFVWARKFGFLSPHDFDADGGRVVLPPAQPNLTMAGRSAEALLRQVDDWHRELSRGRWYDRYRWAHRPDVDDGRYRSAGPNRGDRVTWRIVEQLSGLELAEEGRLMGHCVYVYAEQCARGRSSIYSMTSEDVAAGADRGTVERRLTIQVRARAVVQARGRFNRYPTEVETRVLRRWARDQNLLIGPGAFR